MILCQPSLNLVFCSLFTCYQSCPLFHWLSLLFQQYHLWVYQSFHISQDYSSTIHLYGSFNSSYLEIFCHRLVLIVIHSLLKLQPQSSLTFMFQTHCALYSILLPNPWFYLLEILFHSSTMHWVADFLSI